MSGLDLYLFGAVLALIFVYSHSGTSAKTVALDVLAAVVWPFTLLALVVLGLVNLVVTSFKGERE